MRAFHGDVPAVVRAYAWVLALGADGLRPVAETAVLNNNYLAARLTRVPGVEVSYAATKPRTRLEQIRYSLARLPRTRASTPGDRAAARTTSASRRTSRATSRGSCPSR